MYSVRVNAINGNAQPQTRHVSPKMENCILCRGGSPRYNSGTSTRYLVLINHVHYTRHLNKVEHTQRQTVNEISTTQFVFGAVQTVEPFMEWVTRMDMDMEWISGGYGYFFVKGFGVEWVMG